MMVNLHPCIKFKQTHNPSPLLREQREEEAEEEDDDRQREFMMPTTQLKMRGSSILEERSFPPYKTETKCDH